MATKELLLSIDNGTQSLKALVFDAGGNLIAREQVKFTPYVSARPGWAEQDPRVYWNALCHACQKLFADRGIDKTQIAGVALTTQRGTVVNVDKNGDPLRPAILWLDQRKCYNLPALGGGWGLFFKITGLADTVAYFQSEIEANWIATNQPEIWTNTHKYLLLSGYLTFRLTGNFVDSVGSQVGYVPFDYKRLRWARSWNWKWRCLPVSLAQLPQLVAPGEIMGTISRQASRETGIPTGLPVIAAAADKACEVIGSGSLDSSVGCLSYGTTATINVTHHRYIEPITSLRVSGGGSQSNLALQLTADIFGLPTTRPFLYETSGLGAAIVAAVGLGMHPDFRAAVNAMTRPGDTFEPEPANQRLYDQLYRCVYKRMYGRLKPLYKKIREITGYPK
jgi:sugar (pentulose or hexulose) kinase